MYASEKCQLLEGARESLTLLDEAGIPFALVTSGSRERVERELASFELGSRFRAVVCGEDVSRRKPHPEALHLGLSRLGVTPPEAAYVGDSPEDIEMARAAGVFAVGVPGPFPNRRAVRAASPDLLAKDLLDAIGSLLGN